MKDHLQNEQDSCQRAVGFKYSKFGIQAQPHDLKLKSYHYDFPAEAIASRPSEVRSHAKLMAIPCVKNNGQGLSSEMGQYLGEYVPQDISEKASVMHGTCSELLPNILDESWVVVCNETAVLPVRFPIKKMSQGAGEIFFLPQPGEKNFERVHGKIQCRGTKSIGQKFQLFSATQTQKSLLENEKQLMLAEVTLLEKFDDYCVFALDLNFENFHQQLPPENLYELCQRYGSVPIPPYIRKGQSDQQDLKDYQTIFAQPLKNQLGSSEGGESLPPSVAAPTASLHFDEQLCRQLRAKGVDFAQVNLSVGLGTFSPVSCDDITEHKMHQEFFSISEESWRILRRAYLSKKKILAVGTTTLRVLESIYLQINQDIMCTSLQSTDIFLHPGKKIYSVDALLTNFHWPESSLIMLVSAFLGREKTLDYYKTALDKGYRLFSYGDAMLIYPIDQKGYACES